MCKTEENKILGSYLGQFIIACSRFHGVKIDKLCVDPLEHVDHFEENCLPTRIEKHAGFHFSFTFLHVQKNKFKIIFNADNQNYCGYTFNKIIDFRKCLKIQGTSQETMKCNTIILQQVGSCMFYEIAHIKFDIDSYYQVGNYQEQYRYLGTYILDW